MPDLDLAAYEAAYARVEQKLQLERDWGSLERRVRRQLRVPYWRLARTLTLMGLIAYTAYHGRLHSWVVLAGFTLNVLPGRLKDIRRMRREIAAVESAEDVRLLCKEAADKAFNRAVVTLLLRIVFTVLFLGTALVAGLLGKSPVPGLAAGLVMALHGLWLFFVAMPRRARESYSYYTPEEREAEEQELEAMDREEREAEQRAEDEHGS